MRSTPELSQNRPCWSVMIPIYNPNRDHLQTALESVLDQGVAPGRMEIQLVDDCSTTPLPEDWIRSIGRGRVTMHRNPQNLGLARTWNMCIEQARGEVIHLLHQDDYVLPGFYEALEPGFADPSVGAAFCRHAYVDHLGNSTGESELESHQAEILPDLKYRLAQDSRIQCPAIVVRKSCYDSVGRFRTDLPYVLDWEMWLRVSTTWQVYYDPRILACYRVHGSNQTTQLQRNGEDVRDIGRFFDLAEAALGDPRGRRMAACGRYVYARRALQIACSLVGSHEPRAALAQARGAWKLHPSLALVPGSAKCALKYVAALLGRKPRTKTARASVGAVPGRSV